MIYGAANQPTQRQRQGPKKQQKQQQPPSVVSIALCIIKGLRNRLTCEGAVVVFLGGNARERKTKNGQRNCP